MDGERRLLVFKAVVIVLAVTAIAGVTRLWDLGRPREKVFDEVYYASDGCLYAGIPFRSCGLDDEGERSWVHPPLGKMLIATGIDALGNRPLGWRVSAAAVGTATVALAGAFAFLLWGSPLWAGVAALLIATEHLHFVQSRIAMLDVFLAFFALLGFTLLLWDRVRRDRLDESERGEPQDAPEGARGAVSEAGAAPVAANPAADVEPAPPLRGIGRSGPRWLRVAGGGALAAATAVKWSGVYAWAGGLLLALIWERTRRRRAGVRAPIRAALREEWPSLALAFLAVPAAVYGVTWIRWLAEHGWDVGGLVSNHVAMAEYHLTLEPFRESGEAIHPYMSAAWTWLLLLRPVAYFYREPGGGAAEILGIGNPVLFWGALLFLPYLALSWWTQRDWRAGAILVPVLAQYVPWLFVSRPLFLFYMTPVTPFLALAAVFLLRDLVGTRLLARRWAAAAAAAAVVVSVALFVYFWPVLVGDTISKEAWDARIWFSRWV